MEKNNIEEDLKERGDMAAAAIKEILDELGLFIAYGDGDIIFADRKSYVEDNKRVSVGIRIGLLNTQVYSKIEDVPEHVLDNYEKMTNKYNEFNTK